MKDNFKPRVHIDLSPRNHSPALTSYMNEIDGEINIGMTGLPDIRIDFEHMGDSAIGEEVRKLLTDGVKENIWETYYQYVSLGLTISRFDALLKKNKG